MGSVGYGGLKRAARLSGRRRWRAAGPWSAVASLPAPRTEVTLRRTMVRPARVLAPPAALCRARPRPLRRLVLGHGPPCSGGRLPYSAGDSLTPFAARVPGGEELHQIGTLVEDGVRGPPSKPLSSRLGVSELAADEKVC